MKNYPKNQINLEIFYSIYLGPQEKLQMLNTMPIPNPWLHPWLSRILNVFFMIVVMKDNVFYNYDFCNYNHERHQKYIFS
jgi:hypothetical protein